jgi:hypothetical protein
VKKTILAGIVLAWPLASWAADVFDVKLGLWESTHTVTTEMAGVPATQATMPQLTEAQLAQIPPAQRAQIEAMMKGRGGPGSPQTTVIKYCQTAESRARALNISPRENGCSTKLTSMSATKEEIHMDCTGRFKASGDMVVERVDSEHAKGSMVLKSEGDHPMTMKMSFTTKWLSADCGDVKPLGEK